MNAAVPVVLNVLKTFSSTSDYEDTDYEELFGATTDIACAIHTICVKLVSGSACPSNGLVKWFSLKIYFTSLIRKVTTTNSMLYWASLCCSSWWIFLAKLNPSLSRFQLLLESLEFIYVIVTHPRFSGPCFNWNEKGNIEMYSVGGTVIRIPSFLQIVI